MDSRITKRAAQFLASVALLLVGGQLLVGEEPHPTSLMRILRNTGEDHPGLDASMEIEQGPLFSIGDLLNTPGEVRFTSQHDPWQGTVWEGYCREKHGLPFGFALRVGSFPNLGHLADVHQSLAELIHRAFAPISILRVQRPMSTGRCCATSNEVENQLEPVQRDSTDQGSDHGLNRLAPLPATGTPLADPAYDDAALPPVDETENDAETDASPDSGELPEVETLDQPDVPSTRHPTLPKLSLPHNVLPLQKESRSEHPGTEDEPARVPIDSPYGREPSGTPAPPKNVLPRAKSKDRNTGSAETSAVSVIRILSVTD